MVNQINDNIYEYFIKYCFNNSIMINSHVGTGRNSTGSMHFDKYENLKFSYILHHNYLHPKGGNMGEQVIIHQYNILKSFNNIN